MLSSFRAGDLCLPRALSKSVPAGIQHAAAVPGSRFSSAPPDRDAAPESLLALTLARRASPPQCLVAIRDDQGHLMPREHVAPHSEVIRAISLEDSPCCWVTGCMVANVEFGRMLQVPLLQPVAAGPLACRPLATTCSAAVAAVAAPTLAAGCSTKMAAVSESMWHT